MRKLAFAIAPLLFVFNACSVRSNPSNGLSPTMTYDAPASFILLAAREAVANLGLKMVTDEPFSSGGGRIRATTGIKILRLGSSGENILITIEAAGDGKSIVRVSSEPIIPTQFLVAKNWNDDIQAYINNRTRNP